MARNRIPRGQESEIMRMVLDGERVEDIAADVGVSTSTVTHVRERLGLRSHHTTCARMAQRRAQVRALWEDGASVEEIAEAIDRSRSTVWRALQDCGIRSNRQIDRAAERRERIAEMMDANARYTEIMEELGISSSTVYEHMRAILRERAGRG